MKPKKMASATSQPIKTVNAVDDMNVTSCYVDFYCVRFSLLTDIVRVMTYMLLHINFIRIYGMILLTGNMFQDVQIMKHFRPE